MLANQNNKSVGRRIALGGSHYWLMLLFTLVFHFPLILPGMGMPSWGDFYAFHSPFRIVAAQALHDGNIPFLTQAILGGYQLYSDPQFAFFYPVNFLFSLFVPNPNSEAALDAYILINLVSLSLSAVFFARSFGFGQLASTAAAIIMCMNGFVQMHITHINILQVMAAGYIGGGLLTRLAWSGGRRWRLALGAAMALGAGNLAGHPQTTMFLHYALGIGMVVLAVHMWLRTREQLATVRILAWSLVAVILGGAIAAVQLLPTAHLLSVSSRIKIERLEAMDEAIRLAHLPSILFPGFFIPLRWRLEWPFYIPEHFQWMVFNPLEGLTYCGVVAAALGLVGFLNHLRRWTAHVLLWGAALLLAASLGAQTPVYGWMYDYLPMVKLVRVPSRVMWIFYTAWALLAAAGVQAMVRQYANRGAIRTLVIVVAFISFSGFVALRAYSDSWLQAFITLFVEDRERYEAVVRQNEIAFIRAIKNQFLLGALFVSIVLIVLWFSWRSGGRRTITTVAVIAMATELFIYGFARSYIVDQAPKGVVSALALEAFPFKPEGRAHIPHFVHGGDATNIAMTEDIRLAGGYSVTYSAWVKSMEPFDVPPWRHGIDNKLLDIWNVTDIAVRKRPAMAQVGPFKAPVDDWGWTEIGAPWVPNDEESSISIRGLMPSSLVIDLDDITTPVTQMYTLCTAARSTHLPDGTELARLAAVPRNSSAQAIEFSFRLGEDLADSRHDVETVRGNKPAHSPVLVSYKRESPHEWTDGALMYSVHQKFTTATALQQLVFESTAPYPAILGVNQVYLVLEDGLILPKMPIEIADFKQLDNNNNLFHVLHRKRSRGYAWMVPEAEYGSYKAVENIMWRLSNPQFDPASQVIVDKAHYDPAKSSQLAATNPDNFDGTATVTWHQPEELTIKTSANDRGWLVLSMTWDKGWKAWVDGEPVELGRGNGPHCALPLEAGKHEVRLRYRPVHWWPGVSVSLLSLSIVIVSFAWPRRRA